MVRVIAGGMPGWQITLMAAGAALVGAVAIVVDRARQARKRTPSPREPAAPGRATDATALLAGR
jgi:hypothetical protein